MGGVLTLIFVSKYSFDGTFIISAPLGIRRFVTKLVPFFKVFKKYYPIKWIKLEKERNGESFTKNRIPCISTSRTTGFRYKTK
jgi:esterase/lipase